MPVALISKWDSYKADRSEENLTHKTCIDIVKEKKPQSLPQHRQTNVEGLL